MNKLSERDLKSLIRTAYQNQLAELGNKDPELAKTLKNRLNQLSK
jgi:hypothetical protein